MSRAGRRAGRVAPRRGESVEVANPRRQRHQGTSQLVVVPAVASRPRTSYGSAIMARPERSAWTML